MWLSLCLLLLAGVSHQKPAAPSTQNSEKIQDADFKELLALFLSDALYKAAFIQRYILNVYYQLYVDHLKQYEQPVVNVFKSFFEKDAREKAASEMHTTHFRQTPTIPKIGKVTSSKPKVLKTTKGTQEEALHRVIKSIFQNLEDERHSFNNETVLRVPYQHSIVLPFEEDMFDLLYWRHQFVSKWHFSIGFGLLYIAVIYSLAHAMRDRKPMQLRGPLIVWNGGLALFSTLGMARTGEEWFHTLHNHGFYKSVCYIYPTFSVTGYWFLFFTASKFVELGDTVFLVLRKRPLSFLHCYHHITVLVITVQSGAEQLGPGRWFMCMNFGAHAIMYSYYALVSYGFRFPKWLSASVTTLQIIQLLSGVAISCILLALKTFTDWPCQQTWLNLGICFFIYVSYSTLFLQFFRRAYLTKKTLKKIE